MIKSKPESGESKWKFHSYNCSILRQNHHFVKGKSFTSLDQINNSYLTCTKLMLNNAGQVTWICHQLQLKLLTS